MKHTTSGMQNNSGCSGIRNYRLARACTRQAEEKGKGFNLFDWIGHEVSHHWRGILQTTVFAVCLGVSAGLCAGAEVIELAVEFVANGTSTHNWGNAEKILIRGAIIDGLSFVGGVGVGKALDAGILKYSGLQALESSNTVGVAGKFFGAYKFKGPLNISWYYPGENAARMFGSHLAPEFSQISVRAGNDILSCNGPQLSYRG